MEDNKILRIVYTFFLGILLAIFVGVGINTFYAPPPAPKYPVELNTYGKEMTEKQLTVQQEFDRADEAYLEKMKPYNRNVSVITMAAAVTLLTVSMVFEKRMKIIADGVMLGGLFTLFYSIGRGFASENSKYVFAVVTIGLILVLYLGYHRFVKPHQPATAAKK